MDTIVKRPIQKLGYDFIEEEFLKTGRDEYFFRDQQNQELLGSDTVYRQLRAKEIETLVSNNNASDDWNMIWVTNDFDADLVKGCQFFGRVRIGKLEPYYLEFHNLRRPVGLYNSTICSCDLGDNVVVDNVNFMSHFIVGNECILVNINELSTSPQAKFGNGIVKEGEEEAVRIWLEICNENGGRKVIPFEGMLSADAYLWSKYRADDQLQNRFRQMTETRFDAQRGYYGSIGHRTVIKNTKTIKDVKIGDFAYIKGANKLKNLTINSSKEETSQIGEGCELVNGIIEYGCRIFYGVKAVRFIMAPHSNLKYGARLINSYLGANATVSCCEVLNSLIFPTHEQHHNNSFLCAALVMGQSNIAAGATLGSNHNSRGADGELIAGRGFWPGLCVSLKHNSRFASFTLIAKGDYPSEIDLPLPFSLLSQDTAQDELVIMPGYWFLYNMYALARNSWKYQIRDKRKTKIRELEYDYLAPDTAEDMLKALKFLEVAVGQSLSSEHMTEDQCRHMGHEILNSAEGLPKEAKIYAQDIENSHRKAHLIKVQEAYNIFKKMIAYFGIREWVFSQTENTNNPENLRDLLGKNVKHDWKNIGGQLIAKEDLTQLLEDIKSEKLTHWENVHDRYRALSQSYGDQRKAFALQALLSVKNLKASEISASVLNEWLAEFKETSTWILEQTRLTRRKDYENPFRKMAYESEQEMEAVLGKFSDNEFLARAEEIHRDLIARADRIAAVLV